MSTVTAIPGCMNYSNQPRSSPSIYISQVCLKTQRKQFSKHTSIHLHIYISTLLFHPRHSTLRTSRTVTRCMILDSLIHANSTSYILLISYLLFRAIIFMLFLVSIILHVQIWNLVSKHPNMIP